MVSIVYITSDGSGMMEEDIWQYVQYKKATTIGFVFDDWFPQEDFISIEVFWRLHAVFG